MSTTDAFSILDIGRRLNSLSVAYCDLDDDDPDIQSSDEHRSVHFKIRRRRQARMNNLLTEMSLLRDLALIYRSPKTLVEAAVQLALLFNSIGYEVDTDDLEEMRTGFKKAHRTTAGLARVVAAAAGVDLTQFSEFDTVSLMDTYCPPEPTGQAGGAEQADRVKW
jgi:hypothetical protein